MHGLLVILFAACVLWRGTLGLTVASSKLTVCENLQNNPQNVVDNKSCKKKLIVTQSIQSNQKGAESLYFRTNKIYDEVEKEEARLYNPFIITLSKSSVRIVYPFFYEGTVNNHPYEEVRTKHACRDQYYANESATCGYAYDPNGNKIWDSQGFCCRCSMYEHVPNWLKTILYGGHINRYYRGGQGGLCGYSHKHDKNDKYSHCMRMDNLWYDVFKIGRYRISFAIDIQAYDQVEKVVNNKTVTKLVDGGKIVLNYQKTSGIGKYGRNGFRDYMILPRDMVSLRETSDSCDMVGVSYSSFRKLGGGGKGQGPGCSQKRDSCLNNQPKDLFEQDTALRQAGKKPQYFVERYGKCIGVNRKGPSEDLGIVYERDETMTSLVTLEVSADDMILIYNRASGSIVKSFATNFDALSRNGKMTILVQNTGLVTANFYVVFAGCSEGVIVNHERTASINPKSIHTFTYPINVFAKKGQRHYCSVELYDSRRRLQDSRNVTFKTYTPCVCLHNCVCKCNKVDKIDKKEEKNSGGKACKKPDDKDDDNNDKNKKGGSDGTLFTKIIGFVTGIIGRRIAIVLLLLFLGFAKAMLGRQSLAIAKFGLGGIRTGEQVTKKIYGEERTLVYNDRMDLVDPKTDEMVVPNSTGRDFYINIFIFFLLPVLLVIRIIRVIKPFIKFKSKPIEQLPFEAPKSKEPSGAAVDEPKSTESPKAAAKGRKLRGFPKVKVNAPKLKTSHKKAQKLKRSPKAAAKDSRSKKSPK